MGWVHRLQRGRIGVYNSLVIVLRICIRWDYCIVWHHCHYWEHSHHVRILVPEAYQTENNLALWADKRWGYCGTPGSFGSSLIPWFRHVWYDFLITVPPPSSLIHVDSNKGMSKIINIFSIQCTVMKTATVILSFYRASCFFNVTCFSTLVAK